MKYNLIAVAALTLLASACAQKNASDIDPDLSTNIDSVSYAMGYQNGKFLASQGFDNVNPEAFLAGFNTGNGNQEANKISDEDAKRLIQTFMRDLSTRISNENLEKGQAFLEENKTKEGVQVTESGLQYKVIEEGEGESPTAESTVKVHYEGKLIDGEVFDSSYERGEPIEFPVNGVIPGWAEGVQLMKEGATYEFYIPSELAYGVRAPQTIGPNQALIFKVELIEVVE